MRLTRMHPRPRADAERGVALVEFALVALFLFSLAMGMVEYGLAYQGQERTLGASRTGVRTTASLGTDVESDYQALTSLRADLLAGDMLAQIEVVVIYKSATVDGQPPAACVTSPPAANNSLCNVFTQAQIQNLNKATFSTTTGCSTTAGSISSKWCPNVRNDNQLTADYVGMYVRIRHPFITKFYGSSMAISQRSVMRIEPSGG
jgi:Flp pilus assembly protein TadG